MKYLYLIMGLSFFIKVNAQTESTTDVKADTASLYFIKMLDNTSLSGKIIERSNTEIVFQDLTIGKITIPVRKIRKMNRVSGSQYCIVTSNDGKTYTGIVTSQNQKQIVLKTESLGEITIASEKIRDVKFIEKEQLNKGSYYFPNPHPSRYFFCPSAIPLKRGEGYFQNTYVLSNSIHIGLTDHISVGGGIVIPFLFFGTAKVGYKVANNIHLAAGFLVATTFVTGFDFGMGVGFGSLTLGSHEHNVTVNVGWGTIKRTTSNYLSNNTTTYWELAKNPIYTLSGVTRVAEKIALVTENWIFSMKNDPYDRWGNPIPNGYTYQAVVSGGFRIMGEKNSFDIALVMPLMTGTSGSGLPYLDYVFKF